MQTPMRENKDEAAYQTQAPKTANTPPPASSVASFSKLKVSNRPTQPHLSSDDMKKRFGSEKDLAPKKFVSKKMLGLKSMLAGLKKILGPKILWSKKKF